MERLTYVKPRNHWGRGKFPSKYSSRRTVQEITTRLAEYENTGLTPEEIRPRWFPASTPPKVDGTYLVTMDGALCGEDKPFTGMCGFENGKWDEEGYVLAWRDMPEPWVPELNHERTTKEKPNHE